MLLAFGTNAHYDEWIAPKIFPSFALSSFLDLYQTEKGPYLLTIYGPGSPLFYLPITLGNTPVQIIWIAYTINIITYALSFYFIFLFGSNQQSRSYRFCIGLALTFILLTENTTSSIFKIHHDLPVLGYLLIGSLLLLGRKKPSNSFLMFCGFFFLWMACWTKLNALPWLALPFCQQMFWQKKSLRLWIKALTSLFWAGMVSIVLFVTLFGAKDLWFHIIECTNSYPWRACNALFGHSEDSIWASNFTSKIASLFRISILYVMEYWWLSLSCVLIILKNFSDDSKCVLCWLAFAYFLALPTSLSALAKFGGVENSLVFAHAPGYAALFLQIAIIIEQLIKKKWLKVILLFGFSIFPALGALRTAKSILKDPNDSPQQNAFEYLLENPQNPVFFALAPLSNYLATGKFYDSGEALTFSTMILQDSLPSNAGILGPTEIPFIAFGHPPYSRSFYSKKFDLVTDDETPTLSGWSIYRAIPKTDLQVK